jgi:hypothetical protein
MFTRGHRGGVTPATHEALDTFAHVIAETCYHEYTYDTGKDLISVVTWDSPAKALKIRETAFTYAAKQMTGVVVKQYDATGALVATLEKTFTYGSRELASVTVVRT